MASASYLEELTCPVCLSIFTDPVTLLCGHSFCRECITDVLRSQHQCPQCRTAVPAEGKCLPTSHILKSLAEKAKAEQNQQPREKAQADDLCPEHEEKLKLFCVTDQQLACIICRDGERHQGHKFKPIREAAASLRQELGKGMKNLCGVIMATESLANTQREEITKTKANSQQLMTQIHSQFEEMHQFLRKREDEIKNELKHKEGDAVEEMSKSLNAMETALSERRELGEKVTSVLKIEDPERLLISWTEGNSGTTPQHLSSPRAIDLQVVAPSLCLGPYESHLQFFMWKEMLEVIQPRAELLSLKSTSAEIIVSGDGRSLLCTPKSNQAVSNAPRISKGLRQNMSSNYDLYGSNAYDSYSYPTPPNPGPYFFQSTNHAFSVNEFTSGQHYWEIEVGHGVCWELGMKDHFLKYDGKKYASRCSNQTNEIMFKDRPRKIGIYLNCTSKKLSFYDADNMRHIHTMSSSLKVMPLSAYFNISASAPDSNPLTVCWY